MMDDLTGRDVLVESLWTTLRSTSVLMFGQRRVGKSRLLDYMETQPRLGTHLVRVDLEGLSTVDGAVQRIVDRIAEPRPGIELASRVQGIEVAGVGVQLAQPEVVDPWLRLHRELRRSLSEGGGLVVALDEVPWWLDRLEEAHSGGARTALAQLRHLADDRLLDQVRWILTGSVGLAGRAAQWGASADINHLEPVVVPPLDDVAGSTLFETEVVAHGCSADLLAAREAHRIAGGLPHWIKALASGACATVGSGQRVDVAAVTAELERRLGTLFRHALEEEMHTHFTRRWSPRELAVRNAVLDQVAPHTEPAPRRGIVAAALSLLGSGHSPREVEDVILRLIDEFYLVEQGDRVLFTVPLYSLWWARWGR